MKSDAIKKMLRLHAVAAICLLPFPAFAFLMKGLGARFGGCLLHDCLHIYCPFCGGTRAAEALLRLDVLTALRCHPLVVATAVATLYFYVTAWVRACRDQHELLIFPKDFWKYCLIIFGLFFVLRNVLLIGFGIDPLGDLFWFWNEIR